MNKTVQLGNMQVDARSRVGPDSDIDILVEFEPGTRIGLVKFESFVDELESLSERRIDLVTKSGLRTWVSSSVLLQQLLHKVSQTTQQTHRPVHNIARCHQRVIAVPQTLGFA